MPANPKCMWRQGQLRQTRHIFLKSTFLAPRQSTDCNLGYSMTSGAIADHKIVLSGIDYAVDPSRRSINRRSNLGGMPIDMPGAAASAAQLPGALISQPRRRSSRSRAETRGFPGPHLRLRALADRDGFPPRAIGDGRNACASVLDSAATYPWRRGAKAETVTPLSIMIFPLGAPRHRSLRRLCRVRFR